MSNKTDRPFQDKAQNYWNNNHSVVGVPRGTKRGIEGWNHYQSNLPNPKKRAEWLERYASHGIALLTGGLLEDGTRIAAIDIDDDGYVEPIKRVIGNIVCAKKGKKGLTIFVRVPKSLKSRAIPTIGQRIVDVLVTNKLCVLPPTIHPETDQPYEWVDTPALYEVDPKTLPFMDEVQIDSLEKIIENEHHKSIMQGSGTHDPAVSLMASLAAYFDDEDIVCRMVEAFLPIGYVGNLKEELPEMFRSAKAKFARSAPPQYDAGSIGPIPLGYTQNGGYVFMNQAKRLLAVLTPQSLLAEGNLYDLASAEYWEGFFPTHDRNGKVSGIDTAMAADALMQACRDAGAFLPENVRGCGVWRENGKIVMNWNGEVPKSDKYTYIRFISLPPFNDEASMSAQDLLAWLQLFNWEKKAYAILALGWVASAPVCGALDWRPHIFINGPKNSGKSTIIQGFSDLLHPMAIVRDGGSSEAGIRQTIGADSRPVILDEFESDREVHRMRQVIKMMRSSSSAKGAIAKGTPEGRAMQFQLYSTFCLGAVNPMVGTAADASRIVNLSLAKHENDFAVKQIIQDGLTELQRTAGAWPSQMVQMANLMIANIDVFEREMPPGDIRHNKNMATLIGAAFTALNCREATKEDVKAMLSDLYDTVSVLSLAHEEDDAADCLNRLLCYAVDDMTNL